MEFDGVPARVLVRAGELAEVSRWAAAGDVVRVEVNGGLTLVRGDESRDLQTVDAEYPAYGQILDGLTRRHAVWSSIAWDCGTPWQAVMSLPLTSISRVCGSATR